jgi:hypothetical protein
MASSLPPVRSPGNDRKRSRGPIGVIATVAALITAFAWFVLFETPVERQSAAMRSLSKEAQRLAHDRQVKLLQEYTGFSSPFKIVERWRRDVVNPDGTPGLRETSSETFVASPDSYELTRDGIRIRGRGGDGSGAMRSFVGEAKSRYRHIFEQE